jgi:hypothetical protein
MQLKRSFLIGIAGFILSCCCAALWTGAAHGDVVVGEEHEMPFPGDQTLELVEDVLRGEGILFDVLPDKSVVTLWKPADNAPGLFHSLAGMNPRYRYEISVIPQGGSKSRIVVNVRIEYVPDADLDKYKASRRLDMFNKLDRLAATLPPSQRAPSVGGVNFALLPNEDLRGLAKRVTGDPENWKVIADQNGLTSPTDVTPFQTIWVPDGLIKTKAPPKPAGAP